MHCIKTQNNNSFVYKNVNIIKSKHGTFHLISPVNNTRRIFKKLETALEYIDNAENIDFVAKHLRE